jgi:hypothetical protein
MADRVTDAALLDRVRARVAADGPTLARRALDAGLAVTLPDGSRRPIPIGALPVILDGASLAQRALWSKHLVSATARAARWLLAGHRRDSVLSALSPVERRLVEATWQRLDSLAVARVDFLVGTAPVALEVNATIPAMQGYSDVAAEHWLRTFASDHPELESLIRANGSNSDALLQALRALYAKRRGDALSRVGLLCRRGDAQLTELDYIVRRFRVAGLDAQTVYPDELTFKHGLLEHRDQPLQLLYRHLFINRLEQTPSPALEAALTTNSESGTLILNPPAPHLEMKATLAWLSRSQSEDALAEAMGLSAEERAAIAATVPWTRSLHALSEDELERVASHPDDYVLKRSWSYGGHEVFVGRARHQPDFWSRTQQSFAAAADWSTLCRRAAVDLRGGGFVVQRAISTERSEQFLCTPETVHRVDVVTDYAGYASLGVDVAWGGVCRAAASDVVNIVGGGGVVPLLRRAVVERLTQPISP